MSKGGIHANFVAAVFKNTNQEMSVGKIGDADPPH